MQFAGSKVSFSPQTLASAGAGTNAAAAAGVVDVNKGFGAMREKAPRYDQLSATAMSNQSKEKQAAWNAQSQVYGAGIGAVGQTTSAGMQAKATVEAAEIQADAQKSAAQSSAMGQIAGAALGMFSFSDERCKNTVDSIDDALALLRDLRPVSFYYNPQFTPTPDRKHYGFIAQEFGRVFPDATQQIEDSGYLCIDNNDLIAVLVKAVQQLEMRVKQAEARLPLDCDHCGAKR